MNQLTGTYNQGRNKSLLRVLAGMVLAAAFVLLPATANADSTATYQVSGTLASSGTYSGTIELDHSTSTGLTTLINTNLTVDGISFSCNGQTAGNQCLVYAPVGPDYFQVVSGTQLFLLEWNAINLAGPYPPRSLSSLATAWHAADLGAMRSKAAPEHTSQPRKTPPSSCSVSACSRSFYCLDVG